MITRQTRRFGGLLVRRERWGLSLVGKLLLLSAGLGAALVVQHCIYSFLAVTDRVNGQILVVEGWIPTFSLKDAAAEFSGGRYDRLVVVKAVNDALGNKYESGRYMGGYVSNILVSNGVPVDQLETIYSTVARKDRTYNSALALNRWLAEKRITVQGIDVVTLGPHARRSRLLYEKAFGGGVKIGIVALTDIGYDAAHWWQTSEGVREVVGETLAYGYARFLFFPEPPARSN